MNQLPLTYARAWYKYNSEDGLGSSTHHPPFFSLQQASPVVTGSDDDEPLLLLFLDDDHDGDGDENTQKNAVDVLRPCGAPVCVQRVRT